MSKHTPMKIICRLISRETFNEITSVEIESDCFGASKDNPFPASDIWTCNIWPSKALVTYRVSEAFGNCGTREPGELRAA